MGGRDINATAGTEGIAAVRNRADRAKKINSPKPHNADPVADDGWPVMDQAAYHGIAGRIVRTIAPHTEADPVAVLAHLLIGFGSILGRRAYYLADGARHHANEFALLIGTTSKGRKGTAGRRIDEIMVAADDTWASKCVVGGLSSGEGIIHAVRDDAVEHVLDRKANPPKYIDITKPGIDDKRLLVFEPEFAGALAVARREGSILSRVIREAWDSGDLRVLTKNTPEHATGAHISIVGHITVDEYRASLDRISMTNGYANRFINLLVRRSRELPFGGSLDPRDLIPFADEIKRIIEVTHGVREVSFSQKARPMWEAGYHDLSKEQPGLFGSIVARAEAHVVRLALIYALLDSRNEIDPAHLEAALALWRYAEQSARYIFGDTLGDPVADTILTALRQAGPEGMARGDIYRQLFQGNQSGSRI